MAIDLASIKKIYFVGIGGVGMSATAGIAKAAGFEVSGSDCQEVYAPAKDVLDIHGIPYTIGYQAEHIEQAQADVYVVSAGETKQNPEVAYLVDRDIVFYSFSELLYKLFEDKLRIVVTGTHGKSTTAGLLGSLLQDIDDSSFMVGGVLQHTGSNYHRGDGHYVVFEGDEYKATFDDPTPKFHYYKADILVLTNLEYDHPDMFSSFEELQYEFAELIASLPDDGLIIYNADDSVISRLVHQSNVASFSFGIHNRADYQAETISFGPQGTNFGVINGNVPEAPVEHYQTQLAGEINVYNALAMIATARTLGFKPADIQPTLDEYRGIKRRFEVVAEINGITIIDDYAHHPTAVRETLAAARTRYPGRQIWAIFEPHTFSRTEATLGDLVKSFADADQVLLSKIYPARERIQDATMTSEQVFEQLKLQQPKSRLVQTKEEALAILRKEVTAGDVVIVMAVGHFNRLAYELSEKLKAQNVQ
jgi:UDP-N-acetylmuramate: L-alanyl-gamma-D-glutamyl-meso-diaminopimelate ligase